MNFEKLFYDYHVDYSARVNRGWVNTRCVYCGGSSYKLGFNLSSDYCTCFACGFHNLNETLSKLLGIFVRDVPSVTKNYVIRNIAVNSLNKKKHDGIKEIKLPTNTFTTPERKYLKSRNFIPNYLNEKYGVVGGGVVGEWKHRIIIPIVYDGRIVSFIGRSVLSKSELNRLGIPRYKNLSAEKSVLSCKNILYNMNNVQGRRVVLCEGAFDVLRFDGNAVCSLGTSITQEQMETIAYNYDEVFIIFDDEKEAQNKAKKYGVELSCLGVDVEVVNACEEFGKNDLGECTTMEIEKIKSELNII